MTEKNAFVPGGRSPKIMNCSVDEDIFIEMVHMERPLWDKKHRDYKNLEVKNRVWKSIAVKCKATDLECKRRWTGLREKYRREKIFNCNQRRLGIPVDLTQRWKNYINMMFLDQVYTPRGTYQKTNIPGMNDPKNYLENEQNMDLDMDMKYENDSSEDDENDDDFEANMHGLAKLRDDITSPKPNYSSAASSSSQIPSETLNGNVSANRSLDPIALRTAAENFPRIWVNSLPNLSIIPRNLKDEESSSPSPSQQSDRKAHTATTNSFDSYGVKNGNKYASFGQYIADTMLEMDDKYANELHVHILQEIIKIKSKILKET